MKSSQENIDSLWHLYKPFSYYGRKHTKSEEQLPGINLQLFV
uniref:Uncharacterized protein n=1 Tax=Arundo donax TaxID=35708 RepID=A0A0A9CH44_ARUDO